MRIVLGRQREIHLPKCLRDFVQLHIDEFIKNSKSAMFMNSDHEYVVDVDHTGVSSFIEPRITIIDSNTGADLATSQWSGGLHQFLQIKHGCRLSSISLKAVFVSNVAYLKVCRFISYSYFHS
jgi:preprotein translocase subunit SecA